MNVWFVKWALCQIQKNILQSDEQWISALHLISDGSSVFVSKIQNVDYWSKGQSWVLVSVVGSNRVSALLITHTQKLFTPRKVVSIMLKSPLYFQMFSKSTPQFSTREKNGRRVHFRLRDRFDWRWQWLDSLRNQWSNKNGKFKLVEEQKTSLAHRTAFGTNKHAALPARSPRNPWALRVLKRLYSIDHWTLAIILALDW